MGFTGAQVLNGLTPVTGVQSLSPNAESEISAVFDLRQQIQIAATANNRGNNGGPSVNIIIPKLASPA